MQFRSFATILQEMMDKLAASASVLTDLNVGSATRSLMEAIALVLAEYHAVARELIKRFYVTTATDSWLDQRGIEIGITRVIAIPTRRNLTVSHGAGTPQVTIPVGHLFRTLPGAATQVTYQVTTQTVLAAGSGSATVPVVATVAGSAGNLPNSTSLQQVGTALAAIDTIVTSTITTTGVDTETDTALRARILDRMQNPRGPGSPSDLRQWALEAPGGGATSAAVVKLPRGPGSADVYVLGPSVSLTVIQDYIQPASQDGKATVAADIVVKAPTQKVVDVNITATKGAGFVASTVKAAIEANITAYLNARDIGAPSQIGALGNIVWDTPGIGGPLGKDGGNYSLLQQRISPASFAASDITIAATERIVAGTITATVT